VSFFGLILLYCTHCLIFPHSGRPFEIHPLDIVAPDLNGGDNCVGGFVPTPGDFEGVDMILGATALRSIYAVYDFGDFDANNQMGDPYVQLLSIVDLAQASAEFASVRNVTYSNTPKTNPDLLQKTGDDDSTDIDESFKSDIHKLAKMAPFVFALLGGIALILVVLLVTAIWVGCSFRKQKGGRAGAIPSKRVYQAVPGAEADEYRGSKYSLPYEDVSGKHAKA
jgi:hypothetical protein